MLTHLLIRFCKPNFTELENKHIFSVSINGYFVGKVRRVVALGLVDNLVLRNNPLDHLKAASIVRCHAPSQKILLVRYTLDVGVCLSSAVHCPDDLSQPKP